MVNGYEFEIEGSDDYTTALQNGETPKLDMHKSLILSQIKSEMRKIAIKPSDQFEYALLFLNILLVGLLAKSSCFGMVPGSIRAGVCGLMMPETYCTS